MLLFLWIWLTGSQLVYPQENCGSSAVDTISGVATVIDGDTLITLDDIHIRLLGIDTPEFKHDSGTHDPGAVQARQHLSDYIAGSSRIDLVYDQQRKDQYGRTLAHVFLVDGTNLQAELLRAGLAVPYPFPPNLKFIDCYYAATEEARDSGLGLWSLPQYRPMAVTALQPADIGYRILIGKVSKITKSKRSLIIELNQSLRIFILNKNLKYFDSVDMNRLVDEDVQVAGRVDYRGGVFWLQLRHPGDFRIKHSM